MKNTPQANYLEAADMALKKVKDGQQTQGRANEEMAAEIKREAASCIVEGLQKQIRDIDCPASTRFLMLSQVKRLADLVNL